MSLREAQEGAGLSATEVAAIAFLGLSAAAVGVLHALNHANRWLRYGITNKPENP